MSVEFWIVAWLFGMVLPDGRVAKYHDTFPNRFRTEAECAAFSRTLPNKFPRENQIDNEGAEVRYADFHCLAIKAPGATDAYANSKPSHPLPPTRPRGL